MAAEVFRAKCHAICNFDRKREGKGREGMTGRKEEDDRERKADEMFKIGESS